MKVGRGLDVVNPYARGVEADDKKEKKRARKEEEWQQRMVRGFS